MKESIIVCVVVFVMALSSITVFAGTSYGNTANFSAGAKSYTGQSYVLTNTWAYAYQRTKCTSSNAPAGWLGCKAKLYTSSGSLKKSSSWDYNSKTVSKGTYDSTVCGFDSKKGSAFYSKGQSRGWNSSSSSYVTKNTPKSPNQTSQ